MNNRQVNIFIFFFISTLFLSCDKMQDGGVTFFVANAGDAGKWDAISVSIIGYSEKMFFTPENRNMVLAECGEAENSTTFYLPKGTYSYTVDNGTWSGSFSVDNDDCQLIVLKY